MRAPTKLQLDLARRIIDRAKHQKWPIGYHLRETAIADDFEVSRTPVRQALNLLVQNGIVEARPNHGFFLKQPLMHENDLSLPYSQEDEIRNSLLTDYANGKLPQNLIESELLRQYSLGHSALTRILRRLAEEGLVKRRPGHGWSFVPSLASDEARYESYRFRMMTEPAALLEPKFHLSNEKAKLCREEHLNFLSEVNDKQSAHNFFHINANFHLTLAQCSGNRFVIQAIETQNSLRRLSEFAEYHTLDQGSLFRSCNEHLEILELLEEKKNHAAAEAMRIHLAKNLEN